MNLKCKPFLKFTYSDSKAILATFVKFDLQKGSFLALLCLTDGKCLASQPYT